MDDTMKRKQRLQRLEGQIRKAADEIEKNGLAIGRWLCEIRDDGLWKDGGHPSWDMYLKARSDKLTGKSSVQAFRYVRAAEISTKVPDDLSIIDDTELSATHLLELGRLAPNVGQGDKGGVKKDYSAISPQVVKRVLTAAKGLADGGAPSVRDVRNAVDAELKFERPKPGGPPPFEDVA
jgi:hypothetical protein